MMNVLFPSYSEKTLSVKYPIEKQLPSSDSPTTQPALTEDKVTLSPKAESIVSDKSQKIDWETRTYNGRKLPDNIHKEMTQEMIAGEQNYRVWRFADSMVYEETELNEQDRQFQFDTQLLEGKLNNVQRYTDKLKIISEEKSLLHEVPSNVRLGVSQQLDRQESRANIFLEYSKNDVQSYVKAMMQTYSGYSIDYNIARQGIFHFSNGNIDLDNILATYFTV